MNLDEYTVIGVGASASLTKWGLRFPRGALAAQRAGLEAVRELRSCVNKVWESGRHPGVQSAREEANLALLSGYDVQLGRPVGVRCTAAVYSASTAYRATAHKALPRTARHRP